MTFESYLATLRGKQVAVIGIGVSNIPLIKLFLKKGIAVTACDKCQREAYDNQPLLLELEALGATLHMGAGYLDDLTSSSVPPASVRTSPPLRRPRPTEQSSPRRWRCSSTFAPARPSP